MMVEHALRYAAVGFPILPLLPRGKAPACDHGKDDATTNLDQIAAWWDRNPDYNIGIRPPEGVIVIDVDPQNGGDIKVLGILAVTLAARTGNQGYHLYYRVNGTVRGKVAGTVGIDIKSHTGYLVAAPSIHKNGNPYRWIQKSPVAALPQHLLDKVRPARREPVILKTGSAGNYAGLIRNVTKEGAAGGNRNNALYWSARKATENDAPDEVFALLAEAGESVGLTTVECCATIESARGATA